MVHGNKLSKNWNDNYIRTWNVAVTSFNWWRKIGWKVIKSFQRLQTNFWWRRFYLLSLYRTPSWVAALPSFHHVIIFWNGKNLFVAGAGGSRKSEPRVEDNWPNICLLWTKPQRKMIAMPFFGLWTCKLQKFRRRLQIYSSLICQYEKWWPHRQFSSGDFCWLERKADKNYTIAAKLSNYDFWPSAVFKKSTDSWAEKNSFSRHLFVFPVLWREDFPAVVKAEERRSPKSMITYYTN